MEMNQCTMLQGSTITHIYTIVQEDDTKKNNSKLVLASVFGKEIFEWI